jgi:hypothetical protein
VVVLNVACSNSYADSPYKTGWSIVSLVTKLNPYHIAVVVVVAALALSLVLTVNYFFAVRSEDENKVNNMMTLALGSYSVQIGRIVHVFNDYLAIENVSVLQEAEMLDNETYSYAQPAEMAMDVCLQGSGEEMYSQLWSTASILEGFASNYVGNGLINKTKLASATSALAHISQFFWDFDIVDNKNPIDRLTQDYGTNATATVIYYCQIVQSNVPVWA